MANNNTGFFRVSKTKCKRCKSGYRYAYQINNDLVHADIRKTTLVALKKSVIEKRFLWGITDMEKAINTANETDEPLCKLEGKYGKKLIDYIKGNKKQKMVWDWI